MNDRILSHQIKKRNNGLTAKTKSESNYKPSPHSEKVEKQATEIQNYLTQKLEEELK